MAIKITRLELSASDLRREAARLRDGRAISKPRMNVRNFSDPAREVLPEAAQEKPLQVWFQE